MGNKNIPWITGSLLLFLSVSASAALTNISLGMPFQVNTTTTGYSAYLMNGDHDVGMADNGDFVVGYFRTDGSAGGIWKRAFNADGSAKDAMDVAVNTTITGEQAAVSLGVRKDGSYDLAWHSIGQDVPGIYSVVMRGFGADGSERYGEVSVLPGTQPDVPGGDWWRTPLTTDRTVPEVAVYNNTDPADGALVVSSHYQHNVYPGKTAKDGIVVFSDNPEWDPIAETPAPWIQNLGWNAHYANKAVAVMDNGDGVVLSGDPHHQSNNDLRARYVVFDRSLGSNGQFEPSGKWVQGLPAATLDNAAGKDINSRERWRCAVAMNGTGSGVMVWMALEGDAFTGQTDIVGRRFSLGYVGGTLAVTFDDASEWLVNQVTAGDQFTPRVAMDADGRFMIVWEDDDKNLYGRAFDADGTGPGQFRINPDLAGSLDRYYVPEVAVDKDDEGNMDFVISYVYNPDPAGNAQINNVFAVTGSALVFVPQIVGDLDDDGDVDIFDWAVLQPHFGITSGAIYEQGDLDGDGDIDIFDWAIFQPMYGYGTSSECVPEPATLSLLALLTAVTTLRRRRRQR
ncbi:MAG: PEP-CTERM sorting domain-containing protein [Planctomycetes bacterium]|nr:PEP-CTERM sorting domain-containing protein [Planctomycetota bacterium]